MHMLGCTMPGAPPLRIHDEHVGVARVELDLLPGSRVFDYHETVAAGHPPVSSDVGPHTQPPDVTSIDAVAWFPMAGRARLLLRGYEG